MESLEAGDVLNVKATDPGFKSDIGKWATTTGNELLESGFTGEHFYARIKKGGPKVQEMVKSGHNKSMIVFSDDLDRAIASFIIANGAVSMGREVTMFFTFWGLNIIKKHEKISVPKSFVGRMFSRMLPRGSKELRLSKMHMGGIGSRLIRGIMKRYNVDSLESLIQQALDSGVRIVACNMSMDLMGVHEDELIDGVELGGVATYLAEAELSDTNLFI
jgi:peroxiredoxin family protein